MAKLEAEALLLGIWKNVEDLELSITLQELEMILDANREREHRMMKFQAALKGIDIDAPSQEESRDAFERVRVRAQARLKGEDPEHAELNVMGIEVETE